MISKEKSVILFPVDLQENELENEYEPIRVDYRHFNLIFNLLFYGQIVKQICNGRSGYNKNNNFEFKGRY